MSDLQKADELGKAVAGVENLANEIKQISGDIKILAINSAIEAAHATLSIQKLSEMLLDHLLVSQCWLVAELFTIEAFRNNDYLKDLVRRTGMPNVYITDEDGVVQYTNEDEIMGWRFPDDPKAQAFVFRELLTRQNHVVCQKMQQRTSNTDVFKFVGVSRKDQPGIIQLGIRATDILRYQGETGKVFSVIAQEIRKLSDEVAEVAKGLTNWLSDIKVLMRDS